MQTSERGTTLRNRLPWLITVCVAAISVGLYGMLARWRGLPFAIEPQNVLNIMAPLLLVSGFIERAVEVVISPWRDGQAAKLTQMLAALQAPQTVAAVQETSSNRQETESHAAIAVKTAPSGTPVQIEEAASRLAEYKERTQQYAFLASLTFSLMASCVGVRALWPLLSKVAKYSFENATAGQQGTFLVVDVILPAALLAGGADGIHAVVNSFTTFFNTTAQKAQQSANASS
jgi:hypothetical protein